MDYKSPSSGLTSAQKTGFVLLLIFGILAVGMGVLQMRNNIFGPFALHVTKDNLDESSLFLDENARLQSIDTDHDGLNDYEEMNFYETSAYLPDTDSDGIDDKTEIEKGSNPLCPEGEDCASPEIAPSISTSTNSVAPLNGASQSADFLSSMSPNKDNVDLQAEIQKWIKDPTQLREILLKTGSISKEDLAKIDDATLTKLLQDSLIENGGTNYLIGTNTTTVKQ